MVRVDDRRLTFMDYGHGVGTVTAAHRVGYMQESGHCGMNATLARVREFSVRNGMEANLRTLVVQGLYCADPHAGGMVPRPSVSTA